MKKLFILATLIFTAVFTSVNAEQITFESSDITFYNFYSTNYGYRYDKDLSEFNKDTWTITIPSTQVLIFQKGGLDSTIYFYDIDGNLIDSIKFSEIYIANDLGTPSSSDRLFGTYTIDLTDATYSFPENQISEILSFTMDIMTTNTTSPGGFIDFLADNTFITTGNLPTASFYHEGNLYHQEGYNAIIEGPSSNPATVDGLAFDQWVDANGNPWNPNQPYQDNQDFYSTGQNQAFIRYYSEGVLYDTDSATITDPYQFSFPTDPTASGKLFLWWEFEDGSIVNPNEFYDLEQITEIYARFTIVGTSADAPDNNPETIQGLSFILTTLGWDNTAGYILFLSIILIPLNLLFAYLRFPIFAIGIINLSILGLFVYLQFLPFWAMFILIGSVIMGLIAMARGVINLE